jgi:hypothetical protein
MNMMKKLKHISDGGYQKNPKLVTIAIIFFILSLTLSGCVYKGIRVAGLEPAVHVMEARSYRILGEAEGRSSSFNLLWIIPVTSRINYDAAVREAVTSMRGDDLIDVRTWLERQIWILGMVEILHVRGKVIQYDK